MHTLSEAFASDKPSIRRPRGKRHPAPQRTKPASTKDTRPSRKIRLREGTNTNHGVPPTAPIDLHPAVTLAYSPGVGMPSTASPTRSAQPLSSRGPCLNQRCRPLLQAIDQIVRARAAIPGRTSRREPDAPPARVTALPPPAAAPRGQARPGQASFPEYRASPPSLPRSPRYPRYARRVEP